MGIDLRVEDENGAEIAVLSDSKNQLSHILSTQNIDNTFCLRFIDHYGDTTFNYLQIAVLGQELEFLMNKIENSEDKLQFFKIVELLNEHKNKHHVYLKFYGD